MPKIDIDGLMADGSTGYPELFRAAVAGRSRRRLGAAAGLSQFGVNLTTLTPGAASSMRHWHAAEDEFVYVLAGEVVLCEDGGEVVLRVGDAAGFRAGDGNGHRLVNRSGAEAVYLEVGTRAVRDRVEYPDVDMRLEKDERGGRYLRKSGEPYPLQTQNQEGTR